MKHSRKSMTVCLLVVLCSLPLLAQTTYLIDNTGAGDFISFTEAINHLNSLETIPAGGVRYRVTSGQDFYENPPMIFNVEGTHDNPVIFNATTTGGDNYPTIYLNEANGRALQIANSSYIEINGIKIADPYPSDETNYMIGIYIRDESGEITTSNITIRNCYVQNAAFGGIYSYVRMSGLLIQDNIVEWTTDWNPVNSGMSVMGITQLASATNTAVIERNHVIMPIPNSNQNSPTGIYLGSGSAMNNMVYIWDENDNKRGIDCSTNNASSQVYVYHNTVVISGGNTTAGSYCLYSYQTSNPTAFAARNNIFINDCIDMPGAYNQAIMLQNTATAYDIDENIYYCRNASSGFYGRFGPSEYDDKIYTFASWKATTGLDANSYCMDIPLVDESTGNLHLTHQAALLSELQSDYVGCSGDIDINVRFVYYKGCDEYFDVPYEGDLYITEVSDNRTGANEGSAYLELGNTRPFSLDLGGLQILRGIDNGGVFEYDGYTFTLPANYSIPPRSFCVVTNGSDQATFESDWETTVAWFVQGSSELQLTTGKRYQIQSGASRAVLDTAPVVNAGNRIVQAEQGDWLPQDSADNATPGEIDDGQTLPVTLSSFTAGILSSGAVSIAWTAESETDHLGYNLYRYSEDVLEEAYRLNTAIITEGQTEGTAISYNFVDDDLDGETECWYWLESIALNGRVDVFGPIFLELTTPGEDGEGGEAVNPMVTGIVVIYPNPFNPSTTVGYYLAEETTVEFSVYNVLGQRIIKVDQGVQSEGLHRVTWEGVDASGKAVSSGTYFVRIKAGDTVEIRKCLLIK